MSCTAQSPQHFIPFTALKRDKQRLKAGPTMQTRTGSDCRLKILITEKDVKQVHKAGDNRGLRPRAEDDRGSEHGTGRTVLRLVPASDPVRISVNIFLLPFITPRRHKPTLYKFFIHCFYAGLLMYH